MKVRLIRNSYFISRFQELIVDILINESTKKLLEQAETNGLAYVMCIHLPNFSINAKLIMNSIIDLYDTILFFTTLPKDHLIVLLKEKYIYDEHFLIFEGDKDYLAFMDQERRFPIGDEMGLMEELSELVDQPCYSFWTDDSEVNCNKYKSGKFIEASDEYIFSFSESLGISLPKSSDSIVLPRASSCLIMNHFKKDIPNIIKDIEKEKVSLFITENQFGTLIYNTNGLTNVTVYLFDLVELLLDTPIYAVSIYASERFIFQKASSFEDEDVDYYEYPPSDIIDNTVDNILGEITPKNILKKLDIQPLLDYV